MQEIDQVMFAAEKCQQAFVFALVVDTKGSTYRRSGALMLIRADGSIVGAVSGGCIEKEMIRRAQKVFETGQSLLVEYDGRFTLGCNGTLFILLELFHPQDRQSLFKHYLRAYHSRQRWSLVARYNEEFSGIGLLFNSDELFLISSSEKAVSQYSNFQSRLQSGQHFSKSTGWFHMNVKPSRRLCIIGSEMDAIKLAKLASELGFVSQIVTHPRNPEIGADDADLSSLVVAPESFTEHIQIDQHTAVILMTHSYSRDLAYLKSLVDGPAMAYLGLVGPKMRSNDLLTELLELTDELPDWLDQVLRAPAGLDLGGEIPGEVALAILAEIQMIFAGHAGGELCKKDGGIHDPCQLQAGDTQMSYLASNG